MATKKSKPELQTQSQLTQTDLNILYKCFLDSLNVKGRTIYSETTFELKGSWFKEDKIIGVFSHDHNLYKVYGYPKTNHEIVKYLMEHGYPKIVVQNVSDDPKTTGWFL